MNIVTHTDTKPHLWPHSPWRRLTPHTWSWDLLHRGSRGLGLVLAGRSPVDRAGMDGTRQQRNDLLDTDLRKGQKKITFLYFALLCHSLNLSSFCLCKTLFNKTLWSARWITLCKSWLISVWSQVSTESSVTKYTTTGVLCSLVAGAHIQCALMATRWCQPNIFIHVAKVEKTSFTAYLQHYCCTFVPTKIKMARFSAMKNCGR